MVASSCTHNRGSEPVALSGARPRFYCRHSRRTIKLLFHISRLSSHSYRPGGASFVANGAARQPPDSPNPSESGDVNVLRRYRSLSFARWCCEKRNSKLWSLSRRPRRFTDLPTVICRIRVTLMRRAIHSLINDCQSNRMTRSIMARSKRWEIKWKFNPLIEMSYTFAFMLYIWR